MQVLRFKSCVPVANPAERPLKQRSTRKSLFEAPDATPKPTTTGAIQIGIEALAPPPRVPDWDACVAAAVGAAGRP